MPKFCGDCFCIFCPRLPPWALLFAPLAPTHVHIRDLIQRIGARAGYYKGKDFLSVFSTQHELLSTFRNLSDQTKPTDSMLPSYGGITRNVQESFFIEQAKSVRYVMHKKTRRQKVTEIENRLQCPSVETLTTRLATVDEFLASDFSHLSQGAEINAKIALRDGLLVITSFHNGGKYVLRTLQPSLHNQGNVRGDAKNTIKGDTTTVMGRDRTTRRRRRNSEHEIEIGDLCPEDTGMLDCIDFLLLKKLLFNQASEVDSEIKIEMLFHYFDDHQRGYLGERETRRWLRPLLKGQFYEWEFLRRFLKRDYNIAVHPILGVSFTQFADFYDHAPHLLDQHYENAFELHEHVNMGMNSRLGDHTTYKGGMTRRSAFPSETTNLNAPDKGSRGSDDLSTHDGVEDVGGAQGEEDAEEIDDDKEDFESRLRRDIVTRKLLSIYVHTTQSHRSPKLMQLLNNPGYLAAKIVEIQFRALSPYFGVDFLSLEKRHVYEWKITPQETEAGGNFAGESVGEETSEHEGRHGKPANGRLGNATNAGMVGSGGVMKTTQRVGRTRKEKREADSEDDDEEGPRVKFALQSYVSRSLGSDNSLSNETLSSLKSKGVRRMTEKFSVAVMASQVAIQQKLVDAYTARSKYFESTERISETISNFFDVILQEKVQSIVSVLLSSYSSLDASRLFFPHQFLYTSSKIPLTCAQVMTKIMALSTLRWDDLKQHFDEFPNDGIVRLHTFAIALTHHNLLQYDLHTFHVARYIQSLDIHPG